MTEDTVTHRQADPIKVKLVKGQKENSYGWEITIQGNKQPDIIAEIQSIDEQLRGKYVQKDEPSSEL